MSSIRKQPTGKKEHKEMERRLAAYGITAAASLGLLASACPAQAEVIYTPTKTVLNNGLLAIDLDGDGTADFTLEDDFNGGFFRSNRRLLLQGDVGASVMNSQDFALALGAGAMIGSSRKFRAVNPMAIRMANVGYVCASSSACNSLDFGPWKQAQNRYLGLKFLIGGQVHYGWARLSVVSHYQAGGKSTIRVLLTGYAYETTPGMAIVAGGGAGTQAQVVAPRDATLGQLALGAVAWRKSGVHQEC